MAPNPRLSLVYEGIALCRREQVDFLLAVGGGSVIDSAKAIGYGLVNDGDVWDFYDRKRVATACAPIGVVLTIAAAGSEMSNSSVITKEDGGIKRGYSNDLARAKFAVMDPELTLTCRVTDRLRLCGYFDAHDGAVFRVRQPDAADRRHCRGADAHGYPQRAYFAG